MQRGALLLILSLIGSGCGGATAAPAWDAWACRQGGTLRGGEPERRAREALRRLRVMDHFEGADVSVQVLDACRPCAYAWPGGHLFVTRGLLELLDDDELAAALAHETGHLTSEHDARACAAALNGPGAGAHAADHESLADDAGCALLRASGLPAADALGRALAKVRDDPRTPPSCRPGLTRRIERLARVSSETVPGR